MHISCSSCGALFHHHLKPSLPIVPISSVFNGIFEYLPDILTSDQALNCLSHHHFFKFTLNLGNFENPQTNADEIKLECCVCNYRLFEAFEGEFGEIRNGFGYSHYTYTEDLHLAALSLLT